MIRRHRHEKMMAFSYKRSCRQTDKHTHTPILICSLVQSSFCFKNEEGYDNRLSSCKPVVRSFAMHSQSITTFVRFVGRVEKAPSSRKVPAPSFPSAFDSWVLPAQGINGYCQSFFLSFFPIPLHTCWSNDDTSHTFTLFGS